MSKNNENKKHGVYGKCSACGRKIFTHMQENKKTFDAVGICAVCAHGDASLIHE